ncbi:GNAT family N-acetyltransferase [Paenibacillus sp. KS-LC4]|uniref:GNAT family N-acetyltransferase n=1 Tax=Paenibacillus sp. KS-LC4 TaxID=2979727 RepID=UPI0030CCED63
MSIVVLRLIQQHELLQALELELRCYPPEAAATEAGFQYRFQEYPSYFWSAWSEEGELLGIANGIRTEQESCGDEMKGSHQGEYAGDNFCILTIAVAPAFRRRGIAAKLLDKLIQACENEGLKAIILMCEPHLISFYEQAKFTYVGKASSTHGGIEWYEMRRNLHTMEHSSE